MQQGGKRDDAVEKHWEEMKQTLKPWMGKTATKLGQKHLPTAYTLSYEPPVVCVLAGVPQPSVPDLQVVLKAASRGHLQDSLVGLGGKQYVITAMAKDVYHGIGVDNPREGILIYSAVVLIVGMFEESTPQGAFAEKLIKYGQALAEVGHSNI